MQRIAVPMIGGMVSSTLLTLVVIPAIYALAKGWRLSGAEDIEVWKTSAEEVGIPHDRCLQDNALRLPRQSPL